MAAPRSTAAGRACLFSANTGRTVMSPIAVVRWRNRPTAVVPHDKQRSNRLGSVVTRGAGRSGVEFA